jgi:hypothetical protein
LSAVALRLTDEVGQAALDRIAAGDLAAAATLDQHVAAVRTGLASCQPDQAEAARLVGESAVRAGWPQPARPYHARRTVSARHTAAAPARTATLTAACPDVPFADNPWLADALPGIRLLLHYACGFIEAALSSDWQPTETRRGSDWESMRLAAICHLVKRAEAAAALHPDLRAIA